MQLDQIPVDSPSIIPINSTLQRPESVWQMKDALSLIRPLQPLVKEFGFHVSLGGGVLNHGTSGKDLDLYFLPLDNTKPVLTERLIAFLTEMWGKGRQMFKKKGEQRLARGDNGRLVIHDAPDYPTETNSPYIYKMIHFYSGLRIDVFIIGMKDQAQVKVKEEKAEEAEGLPGRPQFIGVDSVPTNNPPPLPIQAMSPEEFAAWRTEINQLVATTNTILRAENMS